MRLRLLGDVLGSLRYFGRCAQCRMQFLSVRDRVAVVDDRLICARCAALVEDAHGQA